MSSCPMIEPRIDATLRLRDGRALGHAEYGDPDGTPGFYFHGHPGSRCEAQLAHEAAMAHGVRIIALDRPDVGSMSHAAPSIDDASPPLRWPHVDAPLLRADAQTRLCNVPRLPSPRVTQEHSSSYQRAGS